MKPGPVPEALASQMTAAATGLVEVRDGKKRWQLYFDQGALVQTRSNLKSESEASLRAAKPGLSDAQLLRLQAMRRVRNACRATDATVRVDASAAAPAPVTLDTLRVLTRGLGSAVGEDGFAEVLDASPRCVADLSPLGLSEAWRALLSDLDGTRDGAQVVEAMGGKRVDALATLWICLSGGLLSLEPPPAPAGLDIASLIASEIEAAPAPASEPAPAPEPAPEPSSAPAPESEVPLEILDDAVIRPIGSPDDIHVDHNIFDSIPRLDRNRGPQADAAPELDPELLITHQRITAATNHFEVLGVPWDSDEDAFHDAYLALAGQLHPDRYSGAPAQAQDKATEAFDLVRAAWEVLGDADARGAYIDKVIHGKKTEEELAMEQVQNYWAAEAEFKRGVAALNAGRVLQAHERFSEAVEKVPDELEFRAYHGFTTWQVEKTRDVEAAQRGVEVLKEVLEANREQERKLDAGWVLLGRVMREQGHAKGARRCFMQALRINASNSDASRELRRLTEGEVAAKKKGGFLGGLFGRKKKK